MNCCRGCMCEISSKLQPLFSGRQNIPDLFQSLTNIKISQNDGFPTTICLDCIEKIRQFNVFKIQCVRSNTLFKLKSHKTTKRDNPVTNSVLELSSIKFESIKLETLQSIKIETDDNAIDTINEISDEQLLTNKHCESDDIPFESECILKEYKSSDEEGINDDKNDNSNDIDEDKSLGDDVDAKNTTITKSPAIIKKVQRLPKLTVPRKMEKIEYKKKEPEKFPFTCYICNRGFSYQERYEGHLREHEGKRAAVCETCGNEYTQWSDLLKHVRSAHKDDVNVKHKCDCGKIFVYESGLIAHKLTHGGKRTTKLYVCENCGKAFKDSYALKKHSVVHKSETPFPCDECSKQFKSEYRLRRHQFRHKNIRKFICAICEKSFITSPELRVHIQSHSSESKFDCKLCGRMFRQKSQVTMHMRTHEGLY